MEENQPPSKPRLKCQSLRLETERAFAAPVREHDGSGSNHAGGALAAQALAQRVISKGINRNGGT